MALLNVELITKLSNVWMDPVTGRNLVEIHGWNGNKSSKHTQIEKHMGKHETKSYEQDMLVSGNCKSYFC